MWKAVLLISISLGGCHALFETCQVTRCYSLAPDAVDIHDPNKLFPSVERLEAVCPSVRAAFDCILEEFLKCTNQSLEEFSVADHGGQVKMFLGTKGLVEDLCHSTTPTHQAYAQNIECMRELMQPLVLSNCQSEAQSLYGAYKVGKDENQQEKDCMIGAHVGACVSGMVHDSCGEEARAFFVELLKKTGILKYGACTPQHVADLKTKYLDYLATYFDSVVPSGRRSIFEKIFEMRKRK